MDKNNTQYKPLLFINIMIHIREITEKNMIIHVIINIYTDMTTTTIYLNGVNTHR